MSDLPTLEEGGGGLLWPSVHGKVRVVLYSVEVFDGELGENHLHTGGVGESISYFSWCQPFGTSFQIFVCQIMLVRRNANP